MAPPLPSTKITAAPLNGKTIVITGATGYIAQAVIRQLSRVPCQIVRLSRDPNRLRPAQTSQAQMIDAQWPVNGQAPSESHFCEADVIYHFAAQTSGTIAEQDPLEDLRANVNPLLNMLQTLRHGSKRPALIFAGTSTQVGMPQHQPVDECQPDVPVSVYDIHKLLCEQYIEHYSRIGAVRGVSLRLTNVYGPGQQGAATDRGILNLMIRRAIDGQNLTLYGDGTPVRDYLYIEDAAQAFIAAALHAEGLWGRHFVIGSGTGNSLAQAFHLVAEGVAALTGRAPVPVVHVQPPDSLESISSRDFIANSSSFRAKTGWQPLTPLKQGIAQSILATMQPTGQKQP